MWMYWIHRVCFNIPLYSGLVGKLNLLQNLAQNVHTLKTSCMQSVSDFACSSKLATNPTIKQRSKAEYLDLHFWDYGISIADEGALSLGTVRWELERVKSNTALDFMFAQDKWFGFGSACSKRGHVSCQSAHIINMIPVQSHVDFCQKQTHYGNKLSNLKSHHKPLLSKIRNSYICPNPGRLRLPFEKTATAFLANVAPI